MNSIKNESILFILLIISLFSSSKEETKSQCKAKFSSCNFKWDLINNKDDSYGLYICINDCQKTQNKV
jgi:hypothetical protein